MMGRLLSLLAAKAAPLLAAGIFAGLAWPDLASFLAPALVPAVFGLLTAALVRLDWPETVAAARRPRLTMAMAVWLLLISPALMAAVVMIAEPPGQLGAALVLMAAAPPIMSSVAFALLLRLDSALAIVATFAATALAPLTVPLVVRGLLGLLGLTLDLDVGEFMVRLGGLTGGAVLAAYLIRRALTPATLEARASQIDGIAVLLLMLFAVAIMDGVADSFAARPDFVALVVVIAFAANLTLQAAGGLIFAGLGRRRALTAGLVSGNRNLALMMAALAGAAGPDLMLYFAIGQIPIYVLPALLSPLYRRLLPPT